MSIMSHEGYDAVVEYDEETASFHGEVLNLRDVITFQGRSVEELVPVLVAAGVRIRGVRTAEASLEDRFVALTGEGFDVEG